jgi:hypothetical protein
LGIFESPTLHSRSTNFVDSGSDGGVLKTGTKGSLAGRVLSLVSGEDTTKDNFLDSFSWQVGLLDSSYMGKFMGYNRTLTSGIP